MELTVRSLFRDYGSASALRGVSFRAGPGVHALLGANGAGKSTLLRLLAGIAAPDAGEIAFGGHGYTTHGRQIRAVTGYVPQELDLPGHMTPRTLLQYMAGLKGVPVEGANLADMGLEAEADTPLSRLSGGQVRRVAIAQALLGEPRLLLLDEPTAGLDPEERERVLRAIRRGDPRRVVIVSTHVPAEMESLARQVLILQRGQVGYAGSVEALLRATEGSVHEAMVPTADVETLMKCFVVSRVSAAGDCSLLRFVGSRPEGLATQRVAPTLEDAYLIHSRRGA